MSNQEATRHKEYSLIPAGIAFFCLFTFSNVSSFIPILIFNIIALVGIIASALSVVRHADVIAHRVGEPYGSLILAISIVVLEVCLISILMLTGETLPTLLRDTLCSIIMIVLCGLIGVSLLLGGKKHTTQYLNLIGMKQYIISIIPLAVMVLILPMGLENNTFKTWQLVVVGAFCISLYMVLLIIQTKTHQSFFIYEHEDDDELHHGKPSVHSSKWHLAWLGIHLICVIGITKLNSKMLDSLLNSLDAPVALAGFIVAFLALSPEGLGAIRAILGQQTQRGMNILFSSVVATISLTVPIVFLIAIITGKELILGLSIPNAILLICTLMLCQSSFATGQTNKLNGIAHLVLFGAYLMVIFN